MQRCWEKILERLEKTVSRHDAPEMEIVALALVDTDAKTLRRACDGHGWRAHFVDSCAEAWTKVNDAKAPVVFCDRRLEGTNWRDVIQLMALPAHRPSVILLSEIVDDYLIAEVIRRGGFDVLSRPLREAAAARMIGLASAYQRFGVSISTLPLKHYR